MALIDLLGLPQTFNLLKKKKKQYPIKLNKARYACIYSMIDQQTTASFSRSFISRTSDQVLLCGSCSTRSSHTEVRAGWVFLTSADLPLTSVLLPSTAHEYMCIFSQKRCSLSCGCWLTPVISAIWEVVIRRIAVWAAWQKVRAHLSHWCMPVIPAERQ
jgi:hypothetical protein